MSVGTETFLRLLQQQQQAAPYSRSKITRQYQTPYGDTPPMALRRPQPPSAMPTAPKLSPMMQAIANRAAMSKLTPGAGQVGLPTGGAGGMPQPSAPTMPQGGGAPAQTTFAQRFAQPQTQALLGAAIAGAEASGYQDRPVSLGQVLGRMGAGAMGSYQAAEDRIAAQKAGQLKELLTRAKIGTELAKSGQGFSGNSMTAQSFRTLLNIGPKIKSGKATEPEKAQYDLAFGYLAKPKQQKTYDDLGNETITTIPAQDLSQFPSPRGGAGTVGQETTKPSTEAIKSGKFVKAMDSMALNVNSYRQALAKLNRADMLSGAAEVPTDAMANAASIAEGLRLDLKELYELGALVGGDFQILDNLLTSPNSVKAAKMGGTALSIQLDQLEKILAQKLAEKDAVLSGTYSTPVPVNTPEEWAKVKVGQYGKLPNGQIKMKVQTQ
jgi:hypothetical protein